MPWANNEGIRIHYQAEGEGPSVGAPTLVSSHHGELV